MPDPIAASLVQFFAARRKVPTMGNNTNSAEDNAAFRKYFDSFERGEQRHLIRLLCRTTAGEATDLKDWRSEADHLLITLTYPWPKDYRRFILDGKDILLHAFSDDSNLASWIAW